MECTNILAGAATVDITPDLPTELAGLRRGTKRASSASDALEANILTFRIADRAVALVSLDLLYPGAALRESIMRQCRLHEEQLLLTATHTHSAPMTQFGMNVLGIPDPAYVSRIADLISREVLGSMADMTPCMLSYCEGQADHSINRRFTRWRFYPGSLGRRCDIAPDPTGCRDERLRMLKVTRPDGSAAAFLWNYACHPNSYPDRHQISPDYPGIVRRHLRERFGAVPTLFMNGFSGNTRPPFIDHRKNLSSVALNLIYGPRFRTPNVVEWTRWAESLSRVVIRIAEQQGTYVSCSQVRSARCSLPLADITDGSDQQPDLVVQGIRLGDVCILGMNVEPAVEYQVKLARVMNPWMTFATGCIDQTLGYLPTEIMLDEGGYEVEGFRKAFGFTGSYRAGFEHRIEQTFVKIREALL